ncbi:MAG: hypothetical protein IIY06_03890 [Proteobacteria bacterium]|nr:hypothetical protein [Pseudomonadota bacterium]
MRFAHTPAPSSYALRAYVRRASSPDKSFAESPQAIASYALRTYARAVFLCASRIRQTSFVAR